MHVARLQDIADKLAITKVAVSKALHNHPDISEELKAKVNLLVDEMGYIPNSFARHFKTKKTFTIGVLVPTIINIYFSKIVTGIIEICSQQGYTPVILISNEDPDLEQRNLEKLFSLRVDGALICITKNSDTLKLAKHIDKIKLPVVFFDRVPENLSMPFICSDQEKASYNATSLLISNGYTQFAFINGPEFLDISKKRIKGFLTALTENNLPIAHEWIKQGDLSKDSGEKVCLEILNSKSQPEILFCINDEVAYGAYKAIYSKGLKIPENIGVIAFGHKDFANYLLPSLSIIEQYPQELGIESAKMLLEVIESKNSGTGNTNYFKTSFEQGNSLFLPKL